MEKWKTLHSQRLYDRPWLTVRRDEVQLPNGNINPEFYVLEYPDWVNVIAITTDGLMVMERQYRHGIDTISPEICAGVIDPGETPLQAAKRELYEETGFTGGEWTELCVVCGNPSVTNNYTHCFLAQGVERTSAQHLEPTEDIAVELLSPAQVYRMMVDGEILQAMMLAPLWKYFSTVSPLPG